MGSIDSEIANEVAKYYHDPVGFVRFAFEGLVLEDWQLELLESVRDHCIDQAFTGDEPVMPFKGAYAAGHGVGKSCITSLLILWIMSTRPHARGVVTAGTQNQLKTKTWAEISKWKDLCITGHWFDVTATSFTHRSYPKTWRVDAITATADNSDSFAGLHNAKSTPFYIFDESSAVADEIWEVAEGGLTDGEPFFFAFGNPVRNTGAFKSKFKSKYWHKMHIDSRNCKGTNKAVIAQWADEYGEDSDFFKIRVRGVFPDASESQLFPESLVEGAMTTELGRYLPNEPLLCGIDVARGGGDDSYIVFRTGYDGRSHKVYKIGPDKTKNSEQLVSIISQKLALHRPAHTFIDASGLGGPIFDRVRGLGYPCTGVSFGAKADSDGVYADKATEIWFRMKKWMEEGGLVKKNKTLELELTAREYYTNTRGRLKLESKIDMKERGVGSPDWADALAVTFAHPVHVRTLQEFERLESYSMTEWNPLDNI